MLSPHAGHTLADSEAWLARGLTARLVYRKPACSWGNCSVGARCTQLREPVG